MANYCYDTPSATIISTDDDSYDCGCFEPGRVTTDFNYNSGLGGGLGAGYGRGAPPRAYDEYFKAYSMAMLHGRERANVSYGGKSA